MLGCSHRIHYGTGLSGLSRCRICLTDLQERVLVRSGDLAYLIDIVTGKVFLHKLEYAVGVFECFILRQPFLEDLNLVTDR